MKEYNVDTRTAIDLTIENNEGILCQSHHRLMADGHENKKNCLGMLFCFGDCKLRIVAVKLANCAV